MRGQVKVYQKKIVDKRRRRAFYFTLYTFVFLGFLVASLSAISQLDSLLLNQVSVRGNTRLAQGDVERVVFEHLAGNYWAFFSRANALLYPRVEIEEALRTVPLIKEVSVSRSGFNTVVVTVTEKVEIARWCDEGQLKTGTGGLECFSLDENGLVFAPVAGVDAEGFFVFKGVLSGGIVGKQVLEPVDFKKIQFFIHEVGRLSVDPIDARISPPTGYLTIELSSGGKIVVNTNDDLSVVLQNISAVLRDKVIAPSFSDFLAQLEYIKFDAGNKVVYRLKGMKDDKTVSAR